VNKEGIDTMAEEFFEKLRVIDPYVIFDKSGSIGRRYARQDEIGTPICITFDRDTLNDDSVTIRDRDTTKQARIKKDDLLKKSLTADFHEIIQAS
jgi:glycyl-tRNA synthetase